MDADVLLQHSYWQHNYSQHNYWQHNDEPVQQIAHLIGDAFAQFNIVAAR